MDSCSSTTATTTSTHQPAAVEDGSEKTPYPLSSLDDEYDFETCSISSADDEAEMCFGALYDITSQEWHNLILEDADGIQQRREQQQQQQRSSSLSGFVQDRVDTFERNIKRISAAALDDESLRPEDLTRQHGNSVVLKTFNSILSDSQSLSEDNISAIALIERERASSIVHDCMSSSSRRSYHGMNDSSSRRSYNALSDSSRQSLIDFVEARVDTFTKNVDYAQEKAETLTRNIAEATVVRKKEESTEAEKQKNQQQQRSSLSGFVHNRVHTFERNMKAISSIIAAKQA